ncbi:MAG TPA: hypothetical protein VF158_03360 [Longimicrobiales bacterium]
MTNRVAVLLREQAAAQRALADQYAAQINGVTDLDVLEQAERKLTARLEALQRQVEELQHQLEDVRHRCALAREWQTAQQVASWLEAQAREMSPPPAADAIAATGLPVRPPAAPASAHSEPAPTETVPDTPGDVTDTGGRSPFRVAAQVETVRAAPRAQGQDDTPTVTAATKGDDE